MDASDEKPKPGKSTKAETAARVEMVLRIVLKGAQHHEIVQFGAEQGWNVGERMIRKYTARALSLLADRLDRNRRLLIGRHVAQRQAVFAQALATGDLRTALAAVDSEAKLRGLFPDKNARELLKLAAAQAERIAELERKDVAREGAKTDPQERPTA